MGKRAVGGSGSSKTGPKASLCPDVDDATLDVLLFATRVGRLIEQLQAATLRRHGLDRAQLAMLYALWAAPSGAMSQAELAGILVQSESGVTRTVARLLERKLAVQDRDEHDGRVRRIRLTPDGHDAVREAFCDVARRFAPLVQRDGDALVQELRVPLQRLAVALDPKRTLPTSQ